MTINNFVDTTYVINLDSRKDRLESIKEECKKNSISFSRFSAYHPALKDIDSKEYNNMKVAGLNRSKYIESTCGLKRSQVEIIKKAKLCNFSKILILEDDAIFHKDANAIFNKATEQLVNKKWDMIFLGANHVEPFIPISENLCKITKAHTTHAMIISSTLFDKFINELIYLGLEADRFLIERIFPFYDCYCIRPHIAWQRVGYSDILSAHKNYNRVLKK